MFFQAFIKRLLQVCCYMQPSLMCGTLVLLSEILKVKKHILNLSRMSSTPDLGFVKREKDLPIEIDDDDDEEEHFVDAPEEDVDGETEQKPSIGELGCIDQKGNHSLASWDHRRNNPSESSSTQWYTFKKMLIRVTPSAHSFCSQVPQQLLQCPWKKPTALRSGYGVCLGTPASLCALSSISRSLCAHFARGLLPIQLFSIVQLNLRMFLPLQQKAIEYTGKPLEDFTLVRFLDRFAYRNPKNLSKEKCQLNVSSHYFHFHF